jgi:hypothetical protein
LGVSVTDVDQILAEGLGLPVSGGAYITGVTDDSPAQAAGLVPAEVNLDQNGDDSGDISGDISGEGPRGDVIIAVDEAAVGSVTGLITELNRHQPGDSVALTVVRDGESIEVWVTLDTWPEQPAVNSTRRFYHRILPESPGLPDWRILPDGQSRPDWRILPDRPGLPDARILPDFPRDFQIPRFHYKFEIPRFSLPDLTPAVP